jgi:hypothetical protein
MSYNFPQPVQLASDNFQRANENPLSGGGNWVSGFGDQPLQIVSNLVEAAGNFYNYQLYNGGLAWSSDQYSSARIANCLANAFVAVQVRQQGSAQPDTCYQLEPAGPLGPNTLIYLMKRISSAQTIFAQLRATLNIGDVITLAVSGTQLSAYINGVFLPGSSVKDSSITGGYPGIVCQPSSATLSNAQLSAWWGGNMVTPALVTPLVPPAIVPNNDPAPISASLGLALLTPGWPMASVPASNPIANSPNTSPEPNSTDATLINDALIQANETASRVI